MASPDRFWEPTAPPDVLQDWLCGEVKEACRLQIDDLFVFADLHEGKLAIEACGFDYTNDQGRGDCFSKRFELSELLTSWAGGYDGFVDVSNEQAKEIQSWHSAWNALSDVINAKFEKALSLPINPNKGRR
jgi:hypothetical protein